MWHLKQNFKNVVFTVWSSWKVLYFEILQAELLRQKQFTTENSDFMLYFEDTLCQSSSRVDFVRQDHKPIEMKKYSFLSVSFTSHPSLKYIQIDLHTVYCILFEWKWKLMQVSRENRLKIKWVIDLLNNDEEGS